MTYVRLPLRDTIENDYNRRRTHRSHVRLVSPSPRRPGVGRPRRRQVLFAGLLVLLAATRGDSQPLPLGRGWLEQAPIQYAKEDFFIPMRDGVKLDTIVYEPEDTRTDYPILLDRTPYPIRRMRPPAYLARAGYIFAFQSVRGRYRSQGSFILMKPELNSLRNPHAVDEITDSYDTIKWLVKHIPHNNHRVGLMGTSYDGFEAVAGMIDAPRELKVVSPQAPQTDWFVGDDVHHHGAYLLDLRSGGQRSASTVPHHPHPQLLANAPDPRGQWRPTDSTTEHRMVMTSS